MENDKSMIKVNLETLKEKLEAEYVEADYMDGDIIVFDGLKELTVEGALQMDMIIALMCVKGKLQIDINGKTFEAHANDLIICPPNVFLDNYMISPDFDSKIFGLSYNALQRMLHVDKNVWSMILHLVEHPLFHLDEDHLRLIDYYYSLMTFKLKQGKVAYYNDIMHALFQAIFYELCEFISSSLEDKTENKVLAMRQGDLLMNRFLKLLADSQGRERSVTAFAEKLYITPKHLSTVCKAVSGKTALEWIHESTAEVIIQKLRYSDKSIKEIADELNFPNLSFFGKFVKARLGVSPMAYREQFAGRNKR